MSWRRLKEKAVSSPLKRGRSPLLPSYLRWVSTAGPTRLFFWHLVPISGIQDWLYAEYKIVKEFSIHKKRSSMKYLGALFVRLLVNAWKRIVILFGIWRDRRPRLFFGLVVFAVLSMVGGTGGLVVSAQPGFCAICHEMKPEFNTWQSSSHAKVGCSDCHTGAKPWNIPHKASAMLQAYLHLTGQVPDEIELKEKVPNGVCLSCHTKQRTVTASGDLRIPHAKHIDVEGMSCVDCHAGVAHAGIGGKGKNIPHNSPEMLALSSKMEAKEFRPSMASCIACHNQKKVTISCESCHRQIKTPPSHKMAEWKVKHGTEAMGSYSECLYCHDIAKGKPPVKDERPLSAIRENDLCLNCHVTRPPEHDSSWALGHRKVAQSDKTPCLVCHDQIRTAGSPVEKVVACYQCHNSTHSSTWIKEHPRVVKQEGLSSCFRCHDAKSCSTCHAKNGVDRPKGS